MDQLSTKHYFPLLILVIAGMGAGCSESPSDPAPTPVDPVEWLTENAIQIQSIDPSEGEFSDLAPLSGILEGRRIVLLGEQSHGDGTTFLAKTRLVKFLHQEMGFDVLAFESGLYDCRKSWIALNHGWDPVSAFGRGVFSIWASSAQVQPLIEYWGQAFNNGQPLELAGFDCQFTGMNSYNNLVPELEIHLSDTGSAIVDDSEWPAFRTILWNVVRNRYYSISPPDDSQQEGFSAILDSLEHHYENVANDPDPNTTLFWNQLVRSTRKQAHRVWSMDWENYEDNPDSLFNLRDQQMAENLIWLANNPFAGRKIIVWAATFHNARNLSTIEVPSMPGLYDGIIPMGQIVADMMGEEIYTIGFTAGQGEAGTIYQDPFELGPIQEGSFEDIAGQTGLPFLFVDYTNPASGGAWLSQTLVSWPLGYLPMRADWTQIMDGVVYTKTMIPSTPATTIAPRNLTCPQLIFSNPNFNTYIGP